MKNGRWVWWIVISLVAAQLYIVQELFAALLLFSVVFFAFALLVGALRLLQYGAERTIAWGSSLAQGDLSQRSLRRLRSETAR